VSGPDPRLSTLGLPSQDLLIEEDCEEVFIAPTLVASLFGDPGNDGTGERGTAANPFNTVYEATFCVPTYGTVEVVPGNYNERFTVWRPMTLVRSGGSGMVVLGAP